MKKLKNVLTRSVAILFCIALLVVTIFAWFTDSITNKDNRIQTGSLKAGFWAGNSETSFNTAANEVVYPSNPGEKVNLPSSTEPGAADKFMNLKNEHAGTIFNVTNWEPGNSEAKYFKIKNTGTLNLKYDLGFDVLDSKLNEAIQFKITKISGSGTISGVDASGIAMATTLNNVKLSDTAVAPNASDVYKVEYKFLESSGNTYNQETSLTFSVNVLLNAAQVNAKTINVYSITDITGATDAQLAEHPTFILAKNIDATTTDVVLNHLVNIDLNGHYLYVNSFKLENTTEYGTVDVDNGNILVNTLPIVVNVPKASVNWSAYCFLFNGTNFVSANINSTTADHTFNYLTPNVPTPYPFPPNRPAPAQSPRANFNLLGGGLVVSPRSAVSSITVPSGAKAQVENNGTIDTITNDSGAPLTVIGIPPAHSGGSSPIDVKPGKANVWDGSIYEPESNAAKTEYTIKSGAELAWVAQQIAKKTTNFSGVTFNLLTDIDLNNLQWTPIGIIDDGYEFNGTFNGNKHTITGLRIGSSEAYNNTIPRVGLFGETQRDAKISYLSVNGEIYSSAGATVGCFIGRNAGIIYNCSASGSVNHKSDAHILQGIGGFAGNNAHSITNCYATTSVTVDSLAYNGTNPRPSVGGFVGLHFGNNAVTAVNCYAKGTISVSNKDSYFVGGFAGHHAICSFSYLENCYANVNISVNLPAGEEESAQYIEPFAGYFSTNGSSLTHSYFNKNSSTKINGEEKTITDPVIADDYQLYRVESLSAATMNDYWTDATLSKIAYGGSLFKLNDMKIWADDANTHFPKLNIFQN